MAGDAVRFVECFAVGDRVGVATIFVVSCLLEFRDRRRLDLARLQFESHRRIVPRALEIGHVPGRCERDAQRIDGQQSYGELSKAIGQHGFRSQSFKTIIARDQASDDAFRVNAPSLTSPWRVPRRRAPCPPVECARAHRPDCGRVPYLRCRSSSNSPPTQSHLHRHCPQ